MKDNTGIDHVNGLCVMNEQCSGGLHTDCLDLDRQSVLQHFSGVLDGDVALNYLAGMDAADHWAFDHQDAALSQASGVAHTLVRIGAVIQAHVGVLDQVPETLVRVLAYLTTSRAVHVVGYVAQRNPRVLPAMRIADENFENDPVLLEKLILQKRLVALERAGMLARVFSRERLGEIVRIMNLSVDEGERDGS